MIDDILIRLRDWREKAEARDLRRKLRRLEREADAAITACEKYDAEYEQAQSAAYVAACAEAGITLVPTNCGWPKFKTADGKTHLGRPGIYVAPLPYNRPPGPSAELRREITVTLNQLQGMTREQAEALHDRREQEQEARAAAEALHPWPRFRTEYLMPDLRGRDRLIYTNKEA